MSVWLAGGHKQFVHRSPREVGSTLILSCNTFCFGLGGHNALHHPCARGTRPQQRCQTTGVPCRHGPNKKHLIGVIAGATSSTRQPLNLPSPHARAAMLKPASCCQVSSAAMPTLPSLRLYRGGTPRPCRLVQQLSNALPLLVVCWNTEQCSSR
jgi:hypothetical protein